MLKDSESRSRALVRTLEGAAKTSAVVSVTPIELSKELEVDTEFDDQLEVSLSSITMLTCANFSTEESIDAFNSTMCEIHFNFAWPELTSSVMFHRSPQRPECFFRKLRVREVPLS